MVERVDSACSPRPQLVFRAEPASCQTTGNALSTEKHPGGGSFIFWVGNYTRGGRGCQKIKMRNPQIRAIGNIICSVEPVLFPRTVRRNRTVNNRGVDALRQFFRILPNQPKKEACHVDVTQQAFSNGSEVQLPPGLWGAYFLGAD